MGIRKKDDRGEGLDGGWKRGGNETLIHNKQHE